MLAALVVRAGAGDASALARVYELTAPKLNALVLHMLRNQAAADEVLQDVYLTLWRRGATFDPARASPITWLVTIARNKAIDHLRAEAARGLPTSPIDENAVPDPSPSFPERLQRQQERRRLLDCIARLEARQQAAIRAAFFGGLTYEAFAARENLPLGTVKSSIRRGLLRLRACLDR